MIYLKVEINEDSKPSLMIHPFGCENPAKIYIVENIKFYLKSFFFNIFLW